MTAPTPPDAPSIKLVEDAAPATLAAFHAVIDTRSPSEFAEDHIPGAINLPVLSDAERAQVGTLYAASRFEARRLGAALVARNIAAHLEGALAGRPADFKPLVHCWRGGQRSHAMATVLSQVGWRTALLVGGYRTYRHRVQAALYDTGPVLKAVLIDGNTGTGKTDLLHRLLARGLQVIDLEGLANHRGSLFGDRGPQPGQKLFESRLLAQIEALDPARPVVVEAESSKVGQRMVPPILWRAMQAAPRIELVASAEDRARYLVGAYRDIVADRAALDAVLDRLPAHASPERHKTWGAMADAGDFEALATALMAFHYDPAYARSAKKETRRLLGTVRVTPLDDSRQEAAADAVRALIEP